jgi:hypothetical protein
MSVRLSPRPLLLRHTFHSVVFNSRSVATYNVEGVDDAGEVSQNREQNVDQEVGAMWMSETIGRGDF